MTRKTALMRAIREAAGKLRGGSYFVKRGLIDWASFPWRSHQWGLSIVVEVMGIQGPDASDPAVIHLAFGTAIPAVLNPPEIDDDAQDQLDADARALLTAVRQSTVTNSFNETIGFGISDVQEREWHDPQYRAQGLVVSFNALF